ncbi:hypothetical protein [Tahibacter amnicola]|uniref:Lipocalin-like protein n=1 Tax=Tahibacter amnicola TaxID=2976241 RepID=A0ABY6BL81_9GAMM|nr:hypothetical protein [Tahibacter amnicola]UXI70524.1 hypothetical protein N4264_13060 [Tahibacter amnicola]
MSDTDLLGTWKRVGVAGNGDAYPEFLKILPNGLYSGWNSEPGHFTVWDAGTFEASDGTVKISTADDSVRSYRVTVSADRMTFCDTGGVTISYQRDVP